MHNSFVRHRLPAILATCATSLVATIVVNPGFKPAAAFTSSLSAPSSSPSSSSPSSSSPSSCVSSSSSSCSSSSSQTVVQASASRATVSAQTQRTETKETINLISGRIASALTVSLRSLQPVKRTAADTEKSKFSASGPIFGISAGEGEYSRAVWGSYSHSWVNNDWTLLKSRSTMHTGIFGGDIKIGDNALAGMAFSYQSNDGTTSFNNGSINSASYTFTPYGAISFNDNRFVLDLMTGFGGSDTDTSRNFGISKGKYGGQQWMLATHATFSQPSGPWLLSVKGGWTSSYGWSDTFTESDGTGNAAQVAQLGEISIGTRASYSFGAFEPYIGLTFAYDPILGPSTIAASGDNLSRKEVDAVIGFDWKATDRLTASAEVSNMFFRTNESNTTVVVAGRFAF